MDVGLQELVHGVIDQAVTRNGGYAAKCLRHDGDVKMAVALRGPSMAGVQVTLILDDQHRGRKAGLEALPQALLPAGA